MKKIFAALALSFMLFAPPAQAQESDNGAGSINRLTLQAMQAAIKGSKDASDNVVLSPYNALTNMALVGAGAKGSTRNEFAKALFGKDGEAFRAEAENLMQMNKRILAANKGIVEITTANGIWANHDRLQLDPDYEQIAREVFGSTVELENFTDPDVPERINQWASDNTNGLITKIIEKLKKDDAMVLASALYFKGDWSWKFDKELTEDKPFALDGGKKKTTPMMRQDFTEEGRLRWQEGDDYEAVALTYGEKREPYMGMGGTNPSMRIVLLRPKDDAVPAKKWLAKQDAAQPARWLDPAAYENAKGVVELPHIDIKQKTDLIPVLKALGIYKAFGSGADFSGMGQADGGKLYVSKVSHDVVFKTDEEGSEAAAVTTTTIGITSVRIDEAKRIEIKFDRSFVFALQDVATGTVLFMGAVNKPNDEMK